MIRLARLQGGFSVAKSQGPLLREKMKMLKEMKPYIIPFLHSNRLVTKHLLRSYMHLLFSKLCFFGGPLLLKKGINSLQGGTLYDPMLMFLGYGICYSASVMFQSLRNIETVKIVHIALIETASHVYKHMLSMGPEFFFTSSQRKRLFNFYKAQEAFQMNLKLFTQYFLPIGADIILSMSILYYYSGSPFVLSFMASYLAYSIFTIRYSEGRRKQIKLMRDSQRELDFLTSETFGNYYNVKYFQKEKQELQKYKIALERYYKRSMDAQISLGVLNTLQRFIFGAGLTFNMMLAAYYTHMGILSVGDIIMIQTLMLQFLNPLFFLGSMYRSFIDSFIDIREMYNTLQIPARVQPGTRSLQKIRGNIAFHNVFFRYINDNSEYVIDGVSFEVAENKFVALVGQSGSGKSTILNLIFRIYDPHQGQITLDGENLQELDFSFRDQIAVVSQSPYLFNGTVMENIRFGNQKASLEQIELLVQKMGLQELINELPEKYETNVGEKGSIFSGGEKQRICIIRALLKHSKIILLDEPTSSLDAASQQKVMQVLKECSDATRIMVTHRQSLFSEVQSVIDLNK